MMETHNTDKGKLAIPAKSLYAFGKLRVRFNETHRTILFSLFILRGPTAPTYVRRELSRLCIKSRTHAQLNSLTTFYSIDSL